MVNKLLFPKIILDTLLEKYNLKYVFLIGSRARGDHTDNSDYDLVAFCDKEEFRLTGDYFYIDQNFIDLTIYKTEILDNLKAFINIKPEFIDAFPIYGEENDVKTIIEKIRIEYDKGPLIYEEDKLAAIEWLKRLPIRLKNEHLDLLYNYRFKRYSVFILSSYFWLRGLWYHCPKRAFSWLKENDYDAYKAFEKLYEHGSHIRDLEHLVNLIINRERN